MKVIKDVKFKLTEEQIIEKGKSAAQLDNEILELESQLVNLKTKFKSDIGSKRSRLQELLSLLHEGFYFQNVEVEVNKNFEANKVEYLYNGEIVDSREMVEDDREQELPLQATESKHSHLTEQVGGPV